MTFASFVRTLGNRRGGDVGDWPVADLVSDRYFARQLDLIHRLKAFILEHGPSLTLSQAGSLELASLNCIRYSPSGRPATESEWSLADEKVVSLLISMGSQLLLQFRFRDLKLYYFYLPIIFLFLMMGAATYYSTYFSTYTITANEATRIVLGKNDLLQYQATFYCTLIIWALAQGGLGACAFVGASMTSQTLRGEGEGEGSELLVTSLSESSRLAVRIIIGCVFSLILGFPFSLVGMAFATEAINAANFASALKFIKDNIGTIPYAFVPFVLGFSTDLALSVLKRLTDTIGTLFGVKVQGSVARVEDHRSEQGHS